MTTPVLHTPACRAETLKQEQAHAAYVERWPLACNACWAAEVIRYHGPLGKILSGNSCPCCDERCPCRDYALENTDVLPPHPSEYGPCECEEAAMLATLEDY